MTRLPFILLCLALAARFTTSAQNNTVKTPGTDNTLATLKGLYRKLIDAENGKDEATVRQLLWKSPSMLFVAKTKTKAEGGWAGFWSTDTVMAHFHDIYKGIFVMSPDYSKEKVVLLDSKVAETYVPLTIAVGYAGQSGTSKPFLMIVEWIRTSAGWKMATDIALPIPE